jgi:hypothetical protein
MTAAAWTELSRLTDRIEGLERQLRQFVRGTYRGRLERQLQSARNRKSELVAALCGDVGLEAGWLSTPGMRHEAVASFAVGLGSATIQSLALVSVDGETADDANPTLGSGPDHAPAEPVRRRRGSPVLPPAASDKRSPHWQPQACRPVALPFADTARLHSR